jgi:hypothetical protein
MIIILYICTLSNKGQVIYLLNYVFWLKTLNSPFGLDVPLLSEQHKSTHNALDTYTATLIWHFFSK